MCFDLKRIIRKSHWETDIIDGLRSFIACVRSNCKYALLRGKENNKYAAIKRDFGDFGGAQCDWTYREATES